MKINAKQIKIIIFTVCMTIFNIGLADIKQLDNRSVSAIDYILDEKIQLTENLTEENYEKLPSQLNYLDLSLIGELDNTTLTKIRTMTIKNLILANLEGLYDEDLKFLPAGIEYLDISNTSIGGYGLKFLPHTINRVKITGSLIQLEAINMYSKHKITFC